MFLRVTPEIFAAFPDTVLGVVIAHGIDNTGEPAGILAELRQEEARIREARAAPPLSWRNSTMSTQATVSGQRHSGKTCK